RSCIGAAGASNSEVARMLHAALAEILPTAIDVVVDTQIALQAAFGGGPGIIVIAGTGSIAYGRNAQGSAARAGGWGFAISDEGSAHWIGRTAITAILHAHDFDSEDAGLRTAGLHSESGSLLLDCILKTWNARSLEDVARTANSIPPPDFAALFPATLASAEAGDELARDVLTAAGGALARIASAVIRRLFPVAEGVPLAMVGGVFRHAPQVRSVFYNELRKLETRVQLTPEVVDPVQGALNLAREASSPPGKA